MGSSHRDLETRRPVWLPRGTTAASAENLTNTGNMLSIILKTLISLDIMEEDFEEGYDLDYIISTLEDLGVEW